MTLGKTIQIFLPDGNPRGIKIAEITSRTIQALLIPRALLDQAASRDESAGVGVYFLVGSTEEAKPLLYIGEAEDCLSRLRQHNKAKDFWTSALVLVSKTKYFTKTHIKFLEWYCYDAARKAERYRLENSNVPSKPHISEPVEADLLDNFDSIKILLGTLGYPLFERIAKPGKSDVLLCKGKDAQAEGQYTSEGLVVFRGSTSNVELSPSAGTWVSNIRERLLEEGTIELDGNVYRFMSDQIFSSPSAAAAAVLARPANGWTEWKFEDGRTLDEVERQG